MTEKEKYVKRLAAGESEKSARSAVQPETYKALHDRAVAFVDGRFPLCTVDINIVGDEWLAVIHHQTSPNRDKRKAEDVPDKEIRGKTHEDLMTEVKKYLEDCYDDD